MSKTYTVGEFKARFNEVLKIVEGGDTVCITYGRNRRPVASLIPPPQSAVKKRKLGRYAGTFDARVSKDWQLDESEFLEQ
jgi:prevent-host-death family protein